METWVLLIHFTDEETKAREVHMTWQKATKVLQDNDEIWNVLCWFPQSHSSKVGKDEMSQLGIKEQQSGKWES